MSLVQNHNQYKFLVPCDFSDSSDNAVCYAQELALRAHAQVQLLHISRPFTDPKAPMLSHPLMIRNPQGQSIWERYLHEHHLSLENEHGESLVPMTYEVGEGKMVKAILKYAEQHSSDLIILGIHPEDWKDLYGLFNRSLDLAMLAPCPVLLLPPHISYTQLKKIVYASDWLAGDQKICAQIPRLLGAADVQLLFTHVNSNGEAKSPAKEAVLDGINTAIVSLQSDSIPEALIKFGRQNEADLFAITTTQHGRMQNALGESTTHALASFARVPLLILHFND